VTIRRLALVFLAAALVGVFLSGCVAAPDSGSKDGSEPPERTAGSGPPGSTDGSRPPESTLSYGGRSVTGVLGSYCWTPPPSDEGTLFVGGCVDVAGIPVPPKEETLTVPADAVLGFDYGGERQPNSMGAGAYPLVRGRVGEATKRLKSRRSGDRVGIPAELSAGEYVIDIFVYVPEGDVSYYFRVLVE
jgi:hypothetical protein